MKKQKQATQKIENQLYGRGWFYQYKNGLGNSVYTKTINFDRKEYVVYLIVYGDNPHSTPKYGYVANSSEEYNFCPKTEKTDKKNFYNWVINKILNA